MPEHTMICLVHHWRAVTFTSPQGGALVFLQRLTCTRCGTTREREVTHE